MLSLVVILCAWTAAIIPVQEAYSAEQGDLEDIINILKQQQKLELHQNHNHGDFFTSSDDKSDDDEAQFGSLKNQQVLNIIKQGQRKKDTSGRNDNTMYLNKGNARYSDQVVAQLLSQAVKANDRKKTHKKHDYSEYINKRNPSNDLFDSNVQDNDAAYNDPGVKDLNEYSKIYIVLNPEAVQNSKNKNAFNDMISKVLSLSSSTKHNGLHSGRNKKSYKGFAVKGDTLTRRSRRDSNEDSEERRPKRARSEYGGGGGGSGARTAIPYIRHRGDIYEKDH